MKKLLLILIMICVFCPAGFTLEPVATQLEAIENSLWGFGYKKENEQTRLKRIEDTIFGEVDAKKTHQERINKINQALGLESSALADNIRKDLEEAEVADVNYPVVDKLETEFLKQTYPKDTLYARLERLEVRLYGAKQSGQLNERVSKLVESSSAAKMAYSPDDSPYSQNQANSAMQCFNPYDSDSYLQIAGLENSLFGKTYGQDPFGVRLDRLEKKIFQRDFSADDDFTRIQRLQAASSAKNTAKYYDSNKFQKYASTGIQLGTFLLMLLAFIL